MGPGASVALFASLEYGVVVLQPAAEVEVALAVRAALDALFALQDDDDQQQAGDGGDQSFQHRAEAGERLGAGRRAEGQRLRTGMDQPRRTELLNPFALCRLANGFNSEF